MTTNPPSEPRRKRLERKLADDFEVIRRLPGKSDDLVQSYSLILEITNCMGMLGLTSYKGYTLAELRLLRDCLGRMGYRRELFMKLWSVQPTVLPGFDAMGDQHPLPTHPVATEVRLKLESLNAQRVLICDLALPKGEGLNSLTTAGLEAKFGRSDGRLFTFVTPAILLHSAQTFPSPWRCSDCGWSCHQREVRVADVVEQVYERQGIKGVWHVLDNAWADLDLERLPKRPLSSDALSVRGRLYMGRDVKVITIDQASHIGRLADVVRENDGKVRAVRIVPSGNSVALSTPRKHILEVVPYRPEIQRPFGSRMA